MVEFDTVHSSHMEARERDLQAELHGNASVPFHHEDDYLSTIVIEMDNVVDFRAGKVWMNNDELDCVYARVSQDYEEWTQNLLISMEDFKKVLSYSTGKRILNYREL